MAEQSSCNLRRIDHRHDTRRHRTSVEAGNRARIRAAETYFGGLSGINGLTMPPLRRDQSHIYTYFPVQYAARDDLVANFREVLRGGLRRLDLVTRDEFDAQRRVLLRTREMVETLEARVAELEERLR